MQRSLISILASTCVAALVVGAASEAYAAKEKFVRTKPHVNVSGPHSVSNEQLTVSVGVFEPSALGGGAASTKPCEGEVDLRIEDASSGAVLSSRLGTRLSSGAFESLTESSPSASILVRVVVVARDMEVDGKQCVLRGEMEFQDIGSGQVTRRIPIRRADFVKLR